MIWYYQYYSALIETWMISFLTQNLKTASKTPEIWPPPGTREKATKSTGNEWIQGCNLSGSLLFNYTVKEQHQASITRGQVDEENKFFSDNGPPKFDSNGGNTPFIDEQDTQLSYQYSAVKCTKSTKSNEQLSKHQHQFVLSGKSILISAIQDADCYQCVAQECSEGPLPKQSKTLFVTH